MIFCQIFFNQRKVDNIMIYDIRDYGAVAGDKILNTGSIQKTIDACAESGGGRVLISGGTYMTGTIILRDNVDLHIAADGRLLCSPDCSDFPERDDVHHVDSSKLPRWKNACVIFAEECSNISISGMGTIDCNGDSFVKPAGDFWMPYERICDDTPSRVVFFTGCRNVNITDVTMINQPAGWSYWIHDCDRVTFSRIKIDAKLDYPNNDGIHINCSRNVTVSDCQISCGDDCIIVRANNLSLKGNKVCEKVTVTNCTLTSHSGGIRIGWIKDGIIRNCTFSNLVMTDTTVGISVYLPGRGEPRWADEGREHTCIENLSFSNIIMDRAYSYPVYVYIEDCEETWCSAIRNLYFDNLHARGFELPYIKGRKDCKIYGIHFSNCSFEKVKFDESTLKKSHGAIMYDKYEYRSVQIKNAEVSFNNTKFITEE